MESVELVVVLGLFFCLVVLIVAALLWPWVEQGSVSERRSDR